MKKGSKKADQPKAKPQNKASRKGGNINPEGKNSGSTRVNKNTKQLRTQVMKTAMIQALQKHLGILESACRECNVSRQWHYETMRTDPEYKAQVEELKEIALDFAESALFKNIQNRDSTSILFFLKCKGKHRGYVERQEIEIKKADVVKVGFGTDDE